MHKLSLSLSLFLSLSVFVSVNVCFCLSLFFIQYILYIFISVHPLLKIVHALHVPSLTHTHTVVSTHMYTHESARNITIPGLTTTGVPGTVSPSVMASIICKYIKQNTHSLNLVQYSLPPSSLPHSLTHSHSHSLAQTEKCIYPFSVVEVHVYFRHFMICWSPRNYTILIYLFTRYTLNTTLCTSHTHQHVHKQTHTMCK